MVGLLDFLSPEKRAEARRRRVQETRELFIETKREMIEAIGERAYREKAENPNSIPRYIDSILNIDEDSLKPRIAKAGLNYFLRRVRKEQKRGKEWVMATFGPSVNKEEISGAPLMGSREYNRILDKTHLDWLRVLDDVLPEIIEQHSEKFEGWEYEAPKDLRAWGLETGIGEDYPVTAKYSLRLNEAGNFDEIIQIEPEIEDIERVKNGLRMGLPEEGISPEQLARKVIRRELKVGEFSERSLNEFVGKFNKLGIDLRRRVNEELKSGKYPGKDECPREVQIDLDLRRPLSDSFDYYLSGANKNPLKGMY